MSETTNSPARTSNGILVVDPNREQKALKKWTMAELCALAAGELQSRYTVADPAFSAAVQRFAMRVDPQAKTCWSATELMHWLRTNEQPRRTARGNYTAVPGRFERLPEDWTDSELLDFGAGEFGPYDPENDPFLAEALQRFGLPEKATYEAYQHWVLTEERPVMTATGVLVEDRARARWSADLWSTEALDAALCGLIPVTPYATFEQIEAEYRKRREIPAHWTSHELQHFLRTGDDIAAEPPVEVSTAQPEPPVDEVVDTPETVAGGDDAPMGTVVDEVAYFPVEAAPVGEEVPEEQAASELTEVIPEVVRRPDWLGYTPSTNPAQTSNGLPIHSEKRYYTKLQDWTRDELIAWARGEIALGLHTTKRGMLQRLRKEFLGTEPDWVDDDVRQYVACGKLPARTSDGLLAASRHRQETHPIQWLDAELKAYARGELRDPVNERYALHALRLRFKVSDTIPDHAVCAAVASGRTGATLQPPPYGQSLRRYTDNQLRSLFEGLFGEAWIEQYSIEQLAEEARLRKWVGENWTDEAAVTHLRTGAVPATTSGGLLVEDRLRALKSAREWTLPELKAWAAGEIACSPCATDAELMHHAREQVRYHISTEVRYWSEDEIRSVLAGGERPVPLRPGIYLNDPARLRRGASEWTRNELQLWIDGRLPATEQAPEDELRWAVYLRWNIPAVWYWDDAVLFVKEGREVPKTSSGAYVRDRRRDYKLANQWTRDELRDYARGEIAAGAVVRKEDLIRQVGKVFYLPSGASEDLIKRQVSAIKEELKSMTVKFVEEDLKSFQSGMTAAGLTEAAAGRYQGMLYRCITRVLSLTEQDFVDGWSQLLGFVFNHQKTLFHPKNAFRGFSQLNLAKKDVRNFEYLLHVLLATADPSRRVVETTRINWDQALTNVADEAARQRVLGYYNL